MKGLSRPSQEESFDPILCELIPATVRSHSEIITHISKPIVGLGGIATRGLEGSRVVGRPGQQSRKGGNLEGQMNISNKKVYFLRLTKLKLPNLNIRKFN
jgi:hypothetical protein